MMLGQRYVLFGCRRTWAGLRKVIFWLLMVEERLIVDVLIGPWTEREAESVLGIDEDGFDGADLKGEVIILFSYE
jgi:hypothetical protein